MVAKKTYRVAGDATITHGDKDYRKGDEFTADYTDEQEQALVEAGHIKPVNKT